MLRYLGIDSLGRLQQFCHLLHCICKTTIGAHHDAPESVLRKCLHIDQVFYSIGFSGMEYAIDVMTADASKLKNRGLAFAFTSSPYIITAFAGPKVADEFYYRVSWRWGLGCWAIIFPIVAAPLYIMLKTNLRKAEREGHRIQEKSDRTLLQSVWYWIIQFDCE